MKYCQPHSVQEAVRLAVRGSCFLAGGTDLILQIQDETVKPEVLIDLSRIAELKTLKLNAGYLEIGSMLTFSALGASQLVKDQAYALWQACQTMGSPQIRNMATIGGNLGNCSPAADGLPPLLALDARVSLQTAAGQEEVELAQLLGRNPLLAPGTLIKGFRLPLNGWRSGFAKLGRREALAIARLSAAVAVEQDGTRAKQVKVALGAVGKRAFLSHELAAALTDREIDRSWADDAMTHAQRVVAESLGNRPSANYKRLAVAGVMEQVFNALELREGSDGDGH